MSAYEPLEIIIYAGDHLRLIDHIEHTRRIYTDGRNWPADIEPSFSAIPSANGSMRMGTAATTCWKSRPAASKGPRVYDASGIPLHADNLTVVKERIYLDKADRNLLRDEITTIDNALSRPWTVTKNYRRNTDPQPVWREWICAEGNTHVEIGGEPYFLSADGLLMPTKKGQKPPDLRYFDQAGK
jgi:hypothetical protein